MVMFPPRAVQAYYRHLLSV